MAGPITGYSNQENVAFDRGYNDGYRTALEPIRDLHYRTVCDSDDHPVCARCWGPNGPSDWPCATARLIYSTEELGPCDD